MGIFKRLVKHYDQGNGQHAQGEFHSAFKRSATLTTGISIAGLSYYKHITGELHQDDEPSEHAKPEDADVGHQAVDYDHIVGER
jgi:hypothetical protein